MAAGFFDALPWNTLGYIYLGDTPKLTNAPTFWDAIRRIMLSIYLHTQARGGIDDLTENLV